MRTLLGRTLAAVLVAGAGADETPTKKAGAVGDVVKVEVSNGGKKKSIEDKEKVGEILAQFPEVGTLKEYKFANGGIRTHTVTLRLEKGEAIRIEVYGEDEWIWVQRNAAGRTVIYGGWKPKKATGTFLDDLLK